MSQITWRNIDAPDLTNTVRGVAEANRAIQEAFGGFNTALQRFQEDRERNVSKELLAGALGASDEAGLDSFMQGQRAQQLLASGLVNPETLTAVSQQRGNLLNNSLTRTNLGVLEQDITNQPLMADALMALASGRGLADLTDEQRTALALHSQGGTQAANTLFNNRQHDQREDHFRLSHDLQKQYAADQARYNRARLLQNALGGAGGAVSESGLTVRNKNGSLQASDTAKGLATRLAMSYGGDLAGYGEAVTQIIASVPPEEAGPLLEVFNSALKNSELVRESLPDSPVENISLRDAAIYSKLSKALKDSVGDVDPKQISFYQQLFSNYKNSVGEAANDFYIPIAELGNVMKSPVPNTSLIDSPIPTSIAGLYYGTRWFLNGFGLGNIDQYTPADGPYAQLWHDQTARHVRNSLPILRIDGDGNLVKVNPEDIDFRLHRKGK